MQNSRGFLGYISAKGVMRVYQSAQGGDAWFVFQERKGGGSWTTVDFKVSVVNH